MLVKPNDLGDVVWIEIPEEIMNQVGMMEGDFIDLQICNSTIELRKIVDEENAYDDEWKQLP